MAKTTSPASAPSRPLSRSEYVSTLPPWRRLLATLNWRPVYDIEQRTRQLRIERAGQREALEAAAREQPQNRALRAGALFLLEPNPLHRRFLAYIASELAGPPRGEQPNC
jgi:hypothetical protein